MKALKKGNYHVTLPLDDEITEQLCIRRTNRLLGALAKILGKEGVKMALPQCRRGALAFLEKVVITGQICLCYWHFHSVLSLKPRGPTVLVALGGCSVFVAAAQCSLFKIFFYFIGEVMKIEKKGQRVFIYSLSTWGVHRSFSFPPLWHVVELQWILSASWRVGEVMTTFPLRYKQEWQLSHFSAVIKGHH